MNSSEKYSIRDLEKLSGIKAHTIRIWEKRYGIITPGRTQTNIRNYSNEDLKQLLNISLLNKNGYKISAIAGMSQQERVNHLSSLSLMPSGTEGISETLLLSMIELDELKFTQAFMSGILKLGIEQTFIKLIFPFFERVGIMWLTGTIVPAQEHFFSNLIRQKLLAATDALSLNTSPAAKKVLLFLPENELHEIALLFYNYALKARGYKTLYLGQAVPLEGLENTIAIFEPDLVVTGITSAISSPNIAGFIQKASELMKGKAIYYTGPIPDSMDPTSSQKLLTLKDLRALLGL